MAFDQKAFDAKYGTSSRIGYDAANLQATIPAKQAKPANTTLANFVPRVAGQAVGVAKSAVSSLATGVVHDINTTARGIIQGAPKIGTNAQSAAFRDQTIKQLNDAQLHITTQYSQGKISSARYKALLADLTKEYAAVSADAKKQNAEAVAPSEFVKSAAKTAAIPFAFGKLTSTGAGGVAGKAESILQAAKGAPESATAAIAKALPKYGLLDKPTAEQLANVPIKTAQKDYKGAATDLGIAVGVPAAIAGGSKALKKVAPIIKDAAFGHAGSEINKLAFKDGSNVSTALEELAGRAKAGDKIAASKLKQYTEVARKVNQHILDEGNDAYKVTRYYAGGNALEGQTPLQFLDQAAKHIKADAAAKAAGKAGQLPFELNGGTAIAVRWDNAARQEVKQALESGSATVDELVKKGTIPNNPNLIKEIQNRVLAEGPSGVNKIYAAPSSIASKSKELSKLFSETGGAPDTFNKQGLGDYVFARGPKASKNYQALNKTGELVAPKAANPVLGAITGSLKKAGVGLEDANPAQYGQVRDSFAKALDAKRPELNGSQMFKSLEDLADQKGLIDPRQLTTGEITQALRLDSKADATLVRKTLDSAFSKTPLSMRGLAGKVTDLNTQYNPAARYYGRAQMTGRYKANPFFKMQQIIEPGVIGQGLTGGHLNSPKAIDRGIKELVNAGFLQSEGGAIAGNAGKELGDLLPNAAGKVSGKLMRLEERRLVSAAITLADQEGKNLTEFVADKKNAELLKSIVQYSSKGFHSSNFSKALNLAVFPTNYNLKVTGLAIKALAKQPPAVQFAAVKGLSNLNDFMRSDEGIRWRSDNSELLGLLNYFTPVNSINSIVKTVSGKGNLRDLGSIGGLPFGVIAQIMQDTGVGSREPSPYLDPKTGELVPAKLPSDVRGKLSVALADVLGSMFTYPGRQAGLPSKKGITTGAAEAVAGKGSFETIDQSNKLTADQKHTQEVLRAYRGTPAKKPTASVPKLGSASVLKAAVPKLSSLPIHAKPKTKKAKVTAKRIGQPF